MLLTCSCHNPVSRVNEGSILAVQVFDQKKFKKKDQGFLGVINIRVGDVMPDLAPDTDGKPSLLLPPNPTAIPDGKLTQPLHRQMRCLPEI